MAIRRVLLLPQVIYLTVDNLFVMRLISRSNGLLPIYFIGMGFALSYRPCHIVSKSINELIKYLSNHLGIVD